MKLAANREDLVDLAARPRRASLAHVEVDDEVVLCVPETGRTHHLNPIATAVWTCLDGETTLRQLAHDIAAVSEWQRDAVEADLVEVVRGFGRQGLLTDPRSDRQRPIAPAAVSERSPKFVRVPPGACTMRNDLDWAGTRAVLAGRYLLGVRSATPELDRLFGRVLAEHLVPDAVAPPNYSLRMGSTDGVRHHRMFYKCETSVRTRSLQRLLRAVCAYLAAHADEDDATRVQMDAVVLTHDGMAVLLPAELRPLLPSEDALRRRGFSMLDAPTAALDPAGGELVVRPPTFPLDVAALAEAAALEAEPAEVISSVAPGRYPVRCVVHVVARGQPAEPSRATLVARSNRRVRNRAALGAQAALSAVARTTMEADLLVVPASQPTGEILDAVIERLRTSTS
jgi:hypothetical protein